MLKKLSSFFLLLLLTIIVSFLFWSQLPPKPGTEEIPETEFSTHRAFEHVEEISRAPHYVGSMAHSVVRNYLIDELQAMGLQPEIQEGYNLSKKGTLALPQNIIARIPGQRGGKALLLMSHYDSAPHSSYGAADAASGVATVLEGVRTFLARNEDNLNDIILLFTDAEELGLNGAELFVKEHPWAKNVGLALNFEARGSGGSSYMLLETNHGNAELIKGFKKANPDYPVTNSLAYSIYKLLPNDTDLTVLREQGSINGFNFAFIDDHYDYHTANDIPGNLDLETLAHQGSYLMPLLEYFKDADLTGLDAQEDYIYFSLPFGKLLSYPFSWIYPMLVLGFVLFFFLLFYGFYKRKFEFRNIFSSAVPFLISLAGSGLLIYLLWKFCLFIYPEYLEMEHGFTYNGYYYIWAFIFLSLTFCFLSYHKFFKAERQAGLFLFPLFFWLLICMLVSLYLKGAAYFIIPAYFGLLQLFLMLRQKRPNRFLMLLLSLPALIILLPFIAMLPVALGLNSLYLAAVLSVLLFSLFLPVFGYFRRKRGLALLCFIVFNTLFIIAHFKSDFSKERPKPNSLVYLLDADSGIATWNSYDNITDEWTRKYLGADPIEILTTEKTFSSKYGTDFRLQAAAPEIGLAAPGILLERLNPEDAPENLKRYSLKIAPNRQVNRLELFADRSVNFPEFRVNGKEADSVDLGNSRFHIFSKRWHNRLLNYHVTEQDTLRIEFTLKEEDEPEIILFESSYDLLQNQKLGIAPRNMDMMPRPFVLNDAVVIKKIIKVE